MSNKFKSIIMCGLGSNNKIVKSKISQINDLNKTLKVSGKRKRKKFILLFFRWSTYFI